MRWIGIDEAGYGPNLGPLVMTAVVAESRQTQGHSPDVWRDLAATVDRAGGDPARFWIDDSKAVLHGRKGRDRLEATCLALLDAVGMRLPVDRNGLFAAFASAGAEAEVDQIELARWVGPAPAQAPWLSESTPERLGPRLQARPFVPADDAWRFVAVRSVVLAPERFNQRLEAMTSKAQVHFSAFRELLKWAWDLAADGRRTHVQSDKHGGRHYYLEPLYEAIPEAWIERGPEGARLSRYTLRAEGRTLVLSLSPRADADDGLVALASMVSKLLREHWMDVFNDFWCARIPGLRPTAGYPTDALRYRRAMEQAASDLELHPDLWWRRK